MQSQYDEQILSGILVQFRITWIPGVITERRVCQSRYIYDVKYGVIWIAPIISTYTSISS